jgi:signal transduction histidine kinase
LAVVKKMPYIVRDGIDLASRKYAVFDNMIEGVQVIDYGWRYFYVNNSIAIQGLSTKSELLGHTMMEKYPGIENSEMFKCLQQCMIERIPMEIPSEFDFPDGSKGWFELSIQPVPEGIIILYSYITRLKKTQAELKRKLNERNEMLAQISSQKRQLEEFCQIISHNLRAPLSNLFLLGEMLAENHSLEDKFHYFEMQKPIITAIQKTFEELVDATQVKMDSTIKKGLIDLDKAFDKAKKKFEEEIQEVKITVTTDFTRAKTIFYSKKYIHNILTNLLSNAIRYRSLERPSKVHISSYKKDGWVCIDVKDNGLGIDMKKNRNHLFKLHKTFHNHPKAKGFGLFITKIQIEALGGNISAKSIVDQGSTFTVKLYKINSNEKN